MTQLSKSNIVVFPSVRVRSTVAQRRRAPQPILCTRWRVSPMTGRLECAWLQADADDPGVPYSLAS